MLFSSLQTIYGVEVAKNFTTCSHTSLMQDPTDRYEKKVFLLILEPCNCGVFSFEKNISGSLGMNAMRLQNFTPVVQFHYPSQEFF